MELDATAFSSQWVRAWNAQDVPARRYWSLAVERIPDLQFAMEAVYRGIDTIVITYRNQTDGLVNEILQFGDDGRVIEGHGTYLVAGVPTWPDDTQRD